MDLIALFIREKCIQHSDGETPSSLLYEEWLSFLGEKRESMANMDIRKFSQSLSKHYQRVKRSYGNVFVGIILRMEHEKRVASFKDKDRLRHQRHRQTTKKYTCPISVPLPNETYDQPQPPRLIIVPTAEPATIQTRFFSLTLPVGGQERRLTLDQKWKLLNQYTKSSHNSLCLPPISGFQVIPDVLP